MRASLRFQVLLCVSLALWLVAPLRADEVSRSVETITAPPRTSPPPIGGEPIPAPPRRIDTLQDAELRAMDMFFSTYGEEDFSALRASMLAEPYSSGNMNNAMVFISLGTTALQRYMRTKDLVYLDRAFIELEWIADYSHVWTRRWASGPTAVYLASTTLRLQTLTGKLKFPVAIVPRAERLHAQALSILREEAMFGLASTLPHLPLDSSLTGDTKAEENAWMAATFMWAASLLPTDPLASLWERKARQLAYDSIVRPSDPPDAEGIKAATVSETFVLANHQYFPNPFYAVGTLFLLRSGELALRMTGSNRTIPEFRHNVAELKGVYDTYVREDFSWKYPQDLGGDASLFPLWGLMSTTREEALVNARLRQGTLWGSPTVGIPIFVSGDPLLPQSAALMTAIMRAKVVLYYLHGSYLWQAQE